MGVINLYFDDSKTQEGKIKNQYCCLCGVIVYDPEATMKKLKNCKEDVLAEPNTCNLPHIEKFEKQGFHYTDDHYLIRRKFIERVISRSGISAEIVIVQRENLKNEGMQMQIKGIISKFARKCEEDKIRVCIEQADYTNGNFKKDMDDFIEKEGVGNILEIKFLSKKEDFLISVADYIAGIVREHHERVYLGESKGEVKEKAQREQSYDSIKKKIQHIHDYEKSAHLDRRQIIEGLV